MERRIINDLEGLMFPDFIKCQVDNEYRCLLLSGEATDQELYESWLLLISQFYELTENKEAKGYLKRIRTLEALNTKIEIVTALCEAITACFRLLPDNVLTSTEKVRVCLKEWGYDYDFSEKTWQSDLRRVRIDLGNVRIKFKSLEIEHENIEKRKKKGDNPASGKPTKAFWVKQLHAIEAHKKMVFDRKALNMYDFALYIAEIQEYYRLSQPKNRRNGS